MATETNCDLYSTQALKDMNGDITSSHTLHEIEDHATSPMRVSKVNEISHFYLQYRDKHHLKLLRTVQTCLNCCDFSADSEVHRPSFGVGSFCCTRFDLDDCMYRCKVSFVVRLPAIPLINCLTTYKSLQNYKNQQIFYIDYGDITSVHRDSLYVLPASLNLIDPLAYAVSLDVVYIAGEEEKCLNLFNELVADINMVALLRSSRKTSNEDMQLVELHFQKEDMYISQEFIACGLCIKLDNEEINKFDSKKNEDISEKVLLNDLDVWDPAAQEYSAFNNQYNINIEDPSYVTNDIDFKKKANICSYFSKGKKCWKGRLCKFRHSLDTHHYIYTQVQENESLTVNDVVLFQISTLQSPKNMYAHFPLGYRAFDIESYIDYKNSNDYQEYQKHLNHSMLSQKSLHQSGNLFGLADGELCIVRQQNNYLRAKVEYSEESRVMVFYIDFGYKELVDYKSLFEFSKYNLNMPAQAIPITFTNLHEPATSNKVWSQELSLIFSKIVNGRYLNGIVIEEFENDRLFIHLCEPDILNHMKTNYDCIISQYKNPEEYSDCLNNSIKPA